MLNDIGDKSKRNVVLDIAKGIALLCVFYGHFMPGDFYSSQLVYRFHLPVFFFVSGWLFKPQLGSAGIGKMFRSYFVPFLFFWALTFVVMLITYPLFGFVKTLVQHLHPRALAETFFYGEPKFNRSLWFLYSLALVYITSTLLDRVCGGKRGMLMVLALSLAFGIGVDLCQFENGNCLPLHLETVPMGLFFYTMGRGAKYSLSCAGQKGCGTAEASVLSWHDRLVAFFLGTLLLFLVYSGIDSCLDVVNMHHGRFAPYAISDAAIGIIGVMLIAYSISDIPLVGNLLAHIGSNSLIYFACEACIANKILEVISKADIVVVEKGSITNGVVISCVKVGLIWPFVKPLTNALRFCQNKLYGHK